MNDKRARGLCFFYDEKFELGHVCKDRKHLFLLELEKVVHDTNEERNSAEEAIANCEISLQDLNRTRGYTTIRVIVYNQKRAINILIDGGSTHNFVDSNFAIKMGWHIETYRPQNVSVADGSIVQVSQICRRIEWLMQRAVYTSDFLLFPIGSSDMVLGVQWLFELGDIKFNYRKLSLEFEYQGKMLKVQGINPTLKEVDSNSFHNMECTSAHLFMIRVTPTVTGVLVKDKEEKIN
ncbi:uncharacterized protein LOC142173741 [Nicotiana tabacum]|uniref:Uncharacterized protein LOC142173741 n=1 Tax=Nicotiana tabacum TaxID=4097 RepID=A0AC58TE29_TOBAC